MASAPHDPSADEIFSALENEFTRMTGRTPPPSPGQPRCLYSFRVDVVVERVGRRHRLVSVRPVRHQEGSSHGRRDHRPEPPTMPPRHPPHAFPSHHPYDPPLRPSARSAGPTGPQRTTASSSHSTFGRFRSSPPPHPFSPSPSSPPTPASQAHAPTFDRESHQRFMKKLELLIQAEEKWKAQKAHAPQPPTDSVRGRGGDKIAPAPR
ncbi:pr167 [rat cytomegalovirus strain Maastricht]|uniref:Pr167 n=1 Tax=Rat cytomegalovirus (strain Maastricht) TaxID=79700 RepID=Q9DW27_RCMVM|nr:pr167 [rat cytomegalovirus strain Maastricht]AAF99263.1 pr167 [rat cytomegalovirus strain Maastricht]WEG72084.1 protein r168 [Murid betaherpesvirus 2]